MMNLPGTRLAVLLLCLGVVDGVVKSGARAEEEADPVSPSGAIALPHDPAVDFGVMEKSDTLILHRTLQPGTLRESDLIPGYGETDKQRFDNTTPNVRTKATYCRDQSMSEKNPDCDYFSDQPTGVEFELDLE